MVYYMTVVVVLSDPIYIITYAPIYDHIGYAVCGACLSRKDMNIQGRAAFQVAVVFALFFGSSSPVQP